MEYTRDQLLARRAELAASKDPKDLERIKVINQALSRAPAAKEAPEEERYKPSGFWESLGQADVPGAWNAWNREIASDPSLGDAVAGAIPNFPGSALRTAEDVVAPVVHPQATAEAFDTLASGLGEWSNVGLGKVLPESVKPYIGYRQRFSSDTPTPAMAGTQEFGRYMAHRIPHWRETLRDDPAGLISDATALLTGGTTAAARLPGRVGGAMHRVARVTEALQPSNLAVKPVAGILRHVPIIGEERSLARMRRRAPTPEGVRASTREAYEELVRRGIEIDPESHARFATGLQAEVDRPNMYTPSMTPVSRGIIEGITQGRQRGQGELQGAVSAITQQREAAQAAARASRATGSPRYSQDIQRANELAFEEAQAGARAQRGPALPFEDIENARREAIRVQKPGREASDIGLSHVILDRIDQTLDALPDSPAIRQAREYGRRNLLANVIQNIEGSSPRVAGYESSMRGQIASFLKARGHTLTQTEREAFNRIVAREGVENAMHTLSGRLGLLTSAAGGAAGFTHPAIGIPAAITTNLMTRKALESITHGQMDKALRTVLAGREAQGRAQRLTDIRRMIHRGATRGLAGAGTAYGTMTE